MIRLKCCKKEFSVLGSTWTLIFESTVNKERYVAHNGWADTSVKECHVGIRPKSRTLMNDPDEFYRNIARHEVIHAYLFESGLVPSAVSNSKKWSVNETMIEWMAKQMPKIMKTFKELELIKEG